MELQEFRWTRENGQTSECVNDSTMVDNTARFSILSTREIWKPVSLTFFPEINGTCWQLFITISTAIDEFEREWHSRVIWGFLSIETKWTKQT